MTGGTVVAAASGTMMGARTSRCSRAGGEEQKRDRRGAEEETEKGKETEEEQEEYIELRQAKK